MTASRTNLLSFTRVLLTLGFYVTILAVIGATIALVMGYASEPRHIIPPLLTPEQATLAAWAYRTVQLLGGAMAVPVLWLLRAIVDSMRGGDPFVPENGVRLRRIGWLILGANIGFIAASFALPPFFQDQLQAFPGVFTALLIFVLARIFDTGARMRTEIQETI